MKIKKILGVFLVLFMGLVLVACKKDPEPDPGLTDADIIAAARTQLSLGSADALANVKADLSIPLEVTVGDEKVQVAWAIKETGVTAVTLDGNVAKVTRPDAGAANVSLTLVATLTFKEETATKEFAITVIPLEEAQGSYTSFKDAYEAVMADEYELDNYRTPALNFEGVKYYGKTTNGHYLMTTDGTLGYIHGTSNLPDENKVFDVVAKINDYHGYYQLDDVSYIESSETPTFTEVFADTTIDNINAIDHTKDTYPMTFKLKDVKLYVDTEISLSDYNLLIVDKDFDPETADRMDSKDRYFKDAVMVYYTSSDFDQLKAMEGLEIAELDVIYEGYRTDKLVKYVTILSIENHVKLAEELTEQDKLDIAVRSLDIETEFKEAGTIELPKAGLHETTVSWGFVNAEDTNNALIDLDTGAVSIPEEGKVTVKVLATVKLGELTETKEFEIVVGDDARPVTEITDDITLDFTGLDNATSYVTSETKFKVNDFDLVRLNANISQSGDYRGVVLGIRSGNSWESPYLGTHGLISGATKVEFVVNNWNTDADFNLEDFAEEIYIQTSTDGETWVNGPDQKSTWDKSAYGLNTISLDITETEPIFVRLFIKSAGTQTDYQLRLIVGKMIIHAEKSA